MTLAIDWDVKPHTNKQTAHMTECIHDGCDLLFKNSSSGFIDEGEKDHAYLKVDVVLLYFDKIVWIFCLFVFYIC